MIGLKLTVEQREAASPESCNEPRQRDFRGVAGTADHALAKEGAAQRETIEPTDEPFAVPAFDGVGIAKAMEPNEHVLDGAVDPGFRPVRRRRRAQAQRFTKGAIGGDAEAVGSDHLAQRTRRTKRIERKDRTLLWLDPINAVGIAMIGHGEHADRIGAQDELRIERRHGDDHRDGSRVLRQAS
jgi:hypothetical protein